MSSAMSRTSSLHWLARISCATALAALTEVTSHAYVASTWPVVPDPLAFEVGFTSLTSFRDRFRRVTGTTPLAYRRAFRPVG